MTGKKLHQLLLELNASQIKLLQQRCDSSTDKRLSILKIVIENRFEDLETLNKRMQKEVEKRWKSSSEAEKKIKLRRLQNFFAEQIEQLTLISYLEQNSSIRNVILAQSFEKSGNLYLLNTYFDKAFSKSVEEDDLLFQLMGIKGKIRMRYASQSEDELLEAMELNESYISIIHQLNEQKIAEYYENISNIYLEKHSVIEEKSNRYIQEIIGQIGAIQTPLYKASLLVSLAKLHFEEEHKLFAYFEQAKGILQGIEIKNSDYFVLERKIRFLEMRLNFFLGKDVITLIQLADEILKDNTRYSVINSNTLFYKILCEILAGNIDTASMLIDESHVHFKGEGQVLEQHLRGVLYAKMGEDKKALAILQPQMYATNYFLSILSRLIVLKIQIKRGDGAWNKSLIDSTRRYLQLNSGNPLGREANEFVLYSFAQKISKRKGRKKIEKPVLTVLHQFLLEE